MNDNEKLYIVLSLKSILEDLRILRNLYCFDNNYETTQFTNLINRLNLMINEVNNNEI